jgi:hypothetical protein
LFPLSELWHFLYIYKEIDIQKKKQMKKLFFLYSSPHLLLSAQIGGSTQIGNSKWTFGGNAGISGGFGSNSGFGISVAPRVGYKISENVEAGISARNFFKHRLLLFYSLRN